MRSRGFRLLKPIRSGVHGIRARILDMGEPVLRFPALVSVAAVAIITVTTACAANDEQFNLSIKNDTSQAVDVGACNHDSCQSFAYTIRLRPGRSGNSAQDPDGVFRPMEVQSQAGAVLGCLPIQLSKVPPTTTVIDISRMVPCGNLGGSEITGGHDWPFPRY